MSHSTTMRVGKESNYLCIQGPVANEELEQELAEVMASTRSMTDALTQQMSVTHDYFAASAEDLGTSAPDLASIRTAIYARGPGEAQG